MPQLDELVRVATPGAQILVTNSYFGLPGDLWLRRWRTAGLVREAGELCGQGSWQLVAPVGTPERLP